MVGLGYHSVIWAGFCSLSKEVSTGITWDEMQRYDEWSLLEESKWNSNDAQGAGQLRLQLLWKQIKTAGRASHALCPN